MEKIDQKQLEVWHDKLCSSCTKRKENMAKARCQIWHALFVEKSPTAIANAHLFQEHGVCKGYDPKDIH
jgi:hypothetical protein